MFADLPLSRGRNDSIRGGSVFATYGKRDPRFDPTHDRHCSFVVINGQPCDPILSKEVGVSLTGIRRAAASATALNKRDIIKFLQ